MRLEWDSRAYKFYSRVFFGWWILWEGETCGNNTAFVRKETMMSANKTYIHHCAKCNKETTHVPVRSAIARVALRTLKIFVFFISGGFVYPHTLSSDDDTTEVTCTKCLTHCTING
jgi:protein-arginine kinase activator protein McsA